MKKGIIVIGIIALLVLLAGIYRFNFTNKDIYIKDKNGAVLQYDEWQKSHPNDSATIKTFRTKTGKIITLNETHPNGRSLSSVQITTQGFKENQTINLGEIDPVQNIALDDLNNDGFEELYIFTQSAGSGSYSDFQVYGSDKDIRLVKLEKEKIPDTDYAKGGIFEGYQGHDSLFIEHGMLIQKFPVYKENEANSNPTGGFKTIRYQLTEGKFSIIR